MADFLERIRSGYPPPADLHQAASARLSAALLVVEWLRDTPGPHIEVSASWRPSPQRLDVPARTLPLQVCDVAPIDHSEIFCLPHLEPGVYTFELRYRAVSSPSALRATLYLPGRGKGSVWPLKPVSLIGAGKLVLARVLHPQGVRWEQDDWFSGRSESVDTVTKFRFPEGISWSERKKDLRPGRSEGVPTAASP